jgi:hypothetical protein
MDVLSQHCRVEIFAAVTAFYYGCDSPTLMYQFCYGHVQGSRRLREYLLAKYSSFLGVRNWDIHLADAVTRRNQGEYAATGFSLGTVYGRACYLK